MCRKLFLLVDYTYLWLLLLIRQLIEQMDMKVLSSLSAVINTRYQNKNTNEWVHIRSCSTKKEKKKEKGKINIFISRTPLQR